MDATWMSKIIEYINEFPLPMSCVPSTLGAILSQDSVDISASKVNVSTRFEKNKYGKGYE